MIYFRKMPEQLKGKEQTEFARTLLFDAIFQEYGITKMPEIVCSEKGKPRFLEHPEIFFNYSHTRDAVVCAVSDGEIGIDLEKVRSFREKTAKLFCSKEEWEWLCRQEKKECAWLRIWTGKEAYLKCRGTGLIRELETIDTLRESVGEEQYHLISVEMEDYQITVCGVRKWDGYIKMI